MSGTKVYARRRALAAVMVALLAAGACSTPGEGAPSAESPVLYADPSHGICRTLPFQLLEQHVGHRYADFGAWKFAWGAVEVVGLTDTLMGECHLDTTKGTDYYDPPYGGVAVWLYTYPTTAEATAAHRTRTQGKSTSESPGTDIDVDKLAWQDRDTDSGFTSELTAHVLDRNLVMTVLVRAGDKSAEAPTADTLRTATGAFVTESIRRLRGNPPRPTPRPTTAKAQSDYPAPGEGFCRKLPLDLFHDRLGSPIPGYPDEQNYNGTAYCSLRTIGTGKKSRGGTIALWIRRHDTAQQALDFHQAHQPTSLTPTGPAGVTLDVDALDWAYQPPANGQDGMHTLRVVAGNLYLYLDITGYSDNPTPLVDVELAPTIANFLQTTLTALRN
ncbi:hypothetical protein [Micromonospora purpureochromogenes]|uniref:DUF3558 domain-containing protein n=1 Tax=Micromonospora purpureochromogenes TaxID=47872 RepID=A0ABX2RVE9_9ACTN|nr:hypothetical protein [Micromonospora purpureochromogenes]NYF59995.1 hypothetical protein [Micromonospora purpureochromogenes]